MLPRFSFALPLFVALVACGGADAASDVDSSKPAPADVSTTSPVGPAPATLSRTFAIKTLPTNGVRGKHDTCERYAVRYEVDLEAKHVTIERCKGEPSLDDIWATETTLDRALTADEHASLEKQFSALQERPMPPSCAMDGRAYRLEVGASDPVVYQDEDHNCHHLTSIRYVDALRPLAATLAAFDGESEPAF